MFRSVIYPLKGRKDKQRSLYRMAPAPEVLNAASLHIPHSHYNLLHIYLPCNEFFTYDPWRIF